ncbi:MAG: hypothetical protein KC636_34310, partial [Myxococcales bacterium]|nr:hypothetical protein [Myxococcales bacterium]
RPSARPEEPPASPSLPPAPAGSPSLRPPSPAPTPPRVARGAAVPLYNATAVMRLDRAACFDLLKEHHVAFTPVPAAEAREVEIPIRLRGPLEGVRFTIPWSEDEAHDHHAIWDCRLAAAMLPLAAFLSAAGIDEVAYFSALRRGRIVRRKPRSRHNVGLAIDILGFRRGDGPLWKVEDHYPRRTLRECGGRTSARPISPGDHFLEFVCFAHTHGLVHTLLTPDHDRDHANHLHLDLKTGQRDPPDPFTSFHGV